MMNGTTQSKLDIRRLILAILLGFQGIFLLTGSGGGTDVVTYVVTPYIYIWGILAIIITLYYLVSAFKPIPYCRIIDIVLIGCTIALWIFAYSQTKGLPYIIGDKAYPLYNAAYIMAPIPIAFVEIIGYSYNWTRTYKNMSKLTSSKTRNSKRDTTDKADQLLKYKKLLDENAISKEEYDNIKKKILDI